MLYKSRRYGIIGVRKEGNMGKTLSLGELEFDVLKIVWDAEGPLKLRDVFERIKRQPEHESIKYSTVATVLQRLVGKKAVSKEKIEGVFHYRPLVAESEVLKQRVELLKEKFFEGSAQALVSYLIREQKDIDLGEIRKLLAQLEPQAGR